jgi:hypothetical protein
MKTDEEGLAEKLASLDLADSDKFNETYARLQTAMKAISSRQSRLISDKRIVRMFSLMLSLGSRFRSMYQFSMTHINAKLIGIHGGVSGIRRCTRRC